jgi:hypothetical protein
MIGKKSIRSIVVGVASVAFGAAFCAHASYAEVLTYFDSSQVALPWASGATSNTIRCNGYQFTNTLDKWWYPTISLGPGTPTGRPTPITLPAGIDAQAITAGPSGLLTGQGSARVTISRVDGGVFDLISFKGTLLGSTSGAGAAFEVMPLLHGQDGLSDPLTFDATGPYGRSFTYSPHLSGYDTYNISLWVDFGLTGLTVNGAPVPEPSAFVLLIIGTIVIWLGRSPRRVY